MPFVAAKCTNCGAPLTVDSTKDAAICEYCNMPFIIEKAITNVNISGNNNIAVDSAVINISGSAPTIENLIKRAIEFESNGNYKTAVEYYNHILDLDISNIAAKTAIDRILNTPLTSIPVKVWFFAGTLTLTRSNLIFETKRKREVYPIATIVSASRSMANLTIQLTTQSIPLGYAARKRKYAKEMEKALKNVLNERSLNKNVQFQNID